MAESKIKVSWEEVQSAQVDAKLQQQAALNRAQQHVDAQIGPSAPLAYPQVAATPTAFPGVARSGRNLWYNTVFYMTVFGAVGGVSGWATGEISYLCWTDPQPVFRFVLRTEDEISQMQNSGQITAVEADARRSFLYEAFADNPYLQIALDESLDDTAKSRKFDAQAAKDEATMFMQQIAWFSIIGVLLATFLAIADSFVSRNWRSAIINGSVGASLGLVGGVLVALFINRLYTALGGGLGAITAKQIAARTIGWAVLGMFLAIAPGVVLKSWRRFFIGLMGGFAGGLLGGLLFDLVANLTGSGGVARFVAITAIGVGSGIGTGIIENVAKTGWLRVTGGLIVGKQFVLYKNPTYIGSSPQCEVYLFKDPSIAPRHAAIHNVAGGFELEDLRSTTGTLVNGRPISRQHLRNNDVVQISATSFMFQEKARTTAG